MTKVIPRILLIGLFFLLACSAPPTEAAPTAAPPTVQPTPTEEPAPPMTYGFGIHYFGNGMAGHNVFMLPDKAKYENFDDKIIGSMNLEGFNNENDFTVNFIKTGEAQGFIVGVLITNIYIEGDNFFIEASTHAINDSGTTVTVPIAVNGVLIKDSVTKEMTFGIPIELPKNGEPFEVNVNIMGYEGYECSELAQNQASSMTIYSLMCFPNKEVQTTML